MCILLILTLTNPSSYFVVRSPSNPHQTLNIAPQLTLNGFTQKDAPTPARARVVGPTPNTAFQSKSDLTTFKYYI